MGFSWIHILVVLLVVLLVFGGGKLPRLMGDFAKGIKAFKTGMKDSVDSPTTSATSANEQITDAGSTSSNEKA